MNREYLLHNKKAWDKQAAKGNRWTIPVSSEIIADAKKGNWEIVLTPWKPVPREWFPDLQGCEVLCLASAGGQQGPVLAAAGAKVIVYDLSPNQLAQDETVAARENLDLKTVMGDMADLSVFEDESFDLIFHPVSNCFVPDVLPVWQEAFRVLRTGGVMLSGIVNPVVYLFQETESFEEMELRVKYNIPYSDMDSLSNEQKIEYEKEGSPYEFGHSLQDLIGGQIDAGFMIGGFYEDKHNHLDHPLYPVISTYIAIRAVKMRF